MMFFAAHPLLLECRMTCPACTREIIAQSTRELVAGDYSVCRLCFEVMFFTTATNARHVSKAELEALPATARDLLQTMRRHFYARHARYN